jgi:hypothetical protein
MIFKFSSSFNVILYNEHWLRNIVGVTASDTGYWIEATFLQTLP